MNHIYIGIFLSFLCVLLAYVFLSKLILVTVFCVILAVLYFKDDLTVFRYIASHVAYLYLWVCELYSNIQIMYHQSNSANFPARKCIENNGTVSNKFDRLHHRLKNNVHNLNSSYSLSNQPLSPSTWNSTANISSHTNKSYQSLQEISKLSINPVYSRDGGLSPIRSVDISSSNSQTTSPSLRSQNSFVRDSSITIPSSRSRPKANQISQDDNQMRLDAKLFANVSSPGFCGRVAEGLAEVATHQTKYDTAGAFPVVNFKSQSPKIKIKTPVRVRLAPPPSNDILYSSIAASSIPRSSVVGTDESMKSVLQVLKEISRKRIHSHVEDDCDENSKRLRIGESQLYNPEAMLQTSLLQQTIQGKRAREDSSPNEEDVKKRRKPSFNNEYLSSLSSSMSIKAPHLETKKRKAQAVEDSLTLTPVLGKLLKVQTEVTPPPLSPPPALPPREQTPPQPPVPEPKLLKTPSPMAVVDQIKSVEPKLIVKPADTKSYEPETSLSSKVNKDESTTSRLLGRMCGQTVPSPKLDIPTHSHNMFMSTNDLSLSPPKENRLAAMIAVLGGPSEINGGENMTQAENKVIGKALFTSPVTPDTPKQNKKVSFNDSLTTTKIYDRDKSGIGSSSRSEALLLTPSTSKPLESSVFNLSKSPVTSTQDTNGFNAGSALQFKSSGSNVQEESKPQLSSSDSTGASSAVSSSSTQQMSSPLITSSSVTASLTSPLSTRSIAMSQTTVPSTQPTFSFGTGNTTPKPLLPSGNADTAKAFSFGNANLAQPGSSTPTFSPIQANSSQKNDAPKALGFGMLTNKDSSSTSVVGENETKPLVNGFASSTSQLAFKSLTSQSLTNKPSLPAFDINTSKSSQTSFNFNASNNMFSKSNNSSTSVANSITQATTDSSAGTISKLSETKPASSSISANQPASNMFGKSSSLNFGVPSQSQPSPFGTPTSKNAQSSSQNSIFGVNSQQLPAFAITTTPSSSNNTSSVKQTTNGVFGVATNSSNPISFTGSGNSSTPQSNTVFGSSNTSVSTNNSPFTVSSSSNTSQTGVFGAQTNSTSVFGNLTTTSDSKSSLFSTFSATTQQSSPFSTSSASNQISKPLFSNFSQTTSKFGEGNSTTPAFGATTTTGNSVFSNQNNASPAFGSQNAATPTFGNQIAATTAFGSQNTTAPSFGSQNTATPAFGNQNTTAPSFGSQNTATPAFGSQNTATSAFGSQNTATSAFGSQNTTTPTFGSQNTATPAFGSQNSAAFGSQNNGTFGSQNTAPPAFGSQSPAPPAFGSQSPAPPAFGSQSPAPPAFGTQNSAPPAFGSQSTSGAFSLGTSSSGANDTKSVFGSSSSAFMFGSSATSNQPSKPVGAAAPFSFGSSQSTPTQANSTQPSIPTFSAAPSPAFGNNLQPPSFAASVQQPTAAPVFAFGQSSAAPSTGGFQFNATTAPQPVQGGMFNIGSGSTGPRSKTGALRRRPK